MKSTLEFTIADTVVILLLGALMGGLTVYMVFIDHQPAQLEKICIPKMQGFYQSLEDNYVVGVIGTANQNGQQLANQLQQAINNINQLQLQRR